MARRKSPPPDLFAELDPPPTPAAPVAKPAVRTPLDVATVRREMPAGAALAEVAVESVVRGAFTYLAGEALRGKLVPGARVLVPFGPRQVPGYYLGERSVEELAAEGLSPRKLKFIKQRIDVERGEAEPAPLITADLLALARWMARQYVTSLGSVLAAMLPAGVKRGAAAAVTRMIALKVEGDAFDRALLNVSKRAPKQAALLKALREAGAPMAAPALLEKAGAASGALKALEKRGYLSIDEVRGPSLSDQYAADQPAAPEVPVELTEPQRQALLAVEEPLRAGTHEVFVLEGVTGSGKTEVYLRALLTARALGRQGIVLVPEIALTPQTAERFEQRLGRDRVAVLHSHLTDGERAETWRAVRAGAVDVVVGARSALFAPLKNLGCIVIDEEHEGTFKQDSAPRYHARDVAVERARLARAVLVLGSATPSLESNHAVQRKQFKLLHLPERVRGFPMPDVVVVDMREENRDTQRYNYMSRAMIAELTRVLERKEQAILFLNRRGYATVVTCLHCGHTEKCTHCDITLTSHKERDVLTCHYCAYEKPVPIACSACGWPNPKLWGLGTERVEKEVAKRFPDARIRRMDSDTMTQREAYVQTLGAFRRGEVDILVGTQMIAKGLDFPNVTLVGIVLADTALHMPDFRSRERTFQVLEQVAGRAGRSEKGGRVVVQTHLPKDPAVVFASRHDYAGFAEAENRERKLFAYPPYTRLARILVRGKDEDKTREAAERLAAAVVDDAKARGIKVLGPSPATIARLEDKYRFHLLLKAPDGEALAELFDGPAGEAALKLRGAEVLVDIDPQSML